MLLLLLCFKQSKSHSAAKRGWRGSILVFFGGFLFVSIYVYVFKKRTGAHTCLFVFVSEFQTALFFCLILSDFLTFDFTLRIDTADFSLVLFIRILFIIFCPYLAADMRCVAYLCLVVCILSFCFIIYFQLFVLCLFLVIR